jgi:aminoglycoside phosphotransferase (APT) family kinase protein
MNGPVELATVEVAMDLACEVAASLGLGPIELIRSGQNHVFASSKAVIRVSPLSVNADFQVALARQLLEAGVPVAKPVADAIYHEAAKITIWERVRPTGEPIDFRRFGAAIAKLHTLDVNQLSSPKPLPLFGQASWLQVEANLASLAGTCVLSTDDLSILAAACDQVRGWDTKRDPDSFVVCHGDVHPQNVLMSHGEIVIIDWDTLCLGPPGWDHAALMTWSSRWGGDASDYEAFADGYGRDFSSQDSAQLQSQVRLLAPTINLASRASREPLLANELERRMQYWRGNNNPPVWTPQ